MPSTRINEETVIYSHDKIKRIEGIGGHTPAFYCCVCGKTTKKNSSIITCAPDCPNICHPDCADPDDTFHCSQVKQLRAQQGISQDVAYIYGSDISEVQTTSDSLSDVHLEKCRTQQAIITKLLQQLTVFTEGNLTLAELPAAIASAKEVIADCTTSTASIAVTAKAERIDTDFSNLVYQNPTLLAWWDKTPLGKKGASRTVPASPHPAQSEPSQLAPTTQTQTTRRISPQPSSVPQLVTGVQPAPRAASSPSRVSTTHLTSARSNKAGQERRGKNQIKSKKPEIPVCSYCERRGHKETECRTKLQCDFCNKRGHVRDTCLWKTAADRTNTLEQEVRTLFSQLRHTTQSQATHQPQPEALATHQPQIIHQTHQPQTQVINHPQATHQTYQAQPQGTFQPQVTHQTYQVTPSQLQPQLHRHYWPNHQWTTSQWTPLYWAHPPQPVF